MVLKTANRKMHDESIFVVNNVQFVLNEDLFSERDILFYLTVQNGKCPDSIVKFVDFLYGFVVFDFVWWRDRVCLYMIPDAAPTRTAS